MCMSPKFFHGQPAACRTCEDCIEQRKNMWVARAMAERAVAAHTFCITATYANNPDGSRPAGATVFRYSDVQKFMKRLREAYKDKFGARSQIRYIVCGEQGSKGTQRVHWHIVLYADRDLTRLGKFIEFFEREEHEQVLEDKSYDWSLWPHGHVKVQRPDARGIYYAVKYAVKDQFTSERSLGHKRETKSQNWAAAFFKMSKKPPIGFRFLEELFDRYEERGNVPTSFEIPVPDHTGYWFLTGLFLEYAADRCHEINKKRNEETGRDCPAWSSLVASVSDAEAEDRGETIKIKERLCYGQIEPQEAQGESEFEQLRADVSRKQREAAILHAVRDQVRNCGHVLPCEGCLANWSRDQIEELKQEEQRWLARWSDKFKRDEDLHAFRRWWLTRGRASRGCIRRDEPQVLRDLRHYRTVAKLSRKIGGPTEDGGRNQVRGVPIDETNRTAPRRKG